MANNKYFLHELPNGATSWDAQCMKMLLAHPQVKRVRGDMCPHGVESEDEEGIGRVLKSIGWASNSECIADAVSVAHLGLILANLGLISHIWSSWVMLGSCWLILEAPPMKIDENQ